MQSQNGGLAKETGRLRKGWIIFKNGKAELWFLFGLFNTIQLWLLRGWSIINLSIFISTIVVTCFIWGFIEIKKIKPSNVYLSPNQQDNIKSTVALQSGLIELAKGNNEDAVKLFKIARALREKWLD